jgi:hypothetical protein
MRPWEFAVVMFFGGLGAVLAYAFGIGLAWWLR